MSWVPLYVYVYVCNYWNRSSSRLTNRKHCARHHRHCQLHNFKAFLSLSLSLFCRINFFLVRVIVVLGLLLGVACCRRLVGSLSRLRERLVGFLLAFIIFSQLSRGSCSHCITDILSALPKIFHSRTFSAIV